MESIIVLVVYGLFFAGILRLIKIHNSKSDRSNKDTAKASAPKAVVRDPKNITINDVSFDQPVAKNHNHNKDSHNINKQLFNNNPSSILTDDRANDWMARELKEERASEYRMRIMFDLHAEHHSSCEAEMIRRFHEDNCSANDVDTVEK